MRRAFIFLLILPVILFFSPYFIQASDVSLEKDLQKSLEQSKAVLDMVQEKLRTGLPVGEEWLRLRALTDDIKAGHLLLQERFRIREEEVKAHGTKALERHQAMSEGYSKALQEYLGLLESLPPAGAVSRSAISNPQSAIRNLQSLLNRILPKKKSPIFGSLPYRNLKYPVREPSLGLEVKPAYKGDNKTVSPEDLKSTGEAPISTEIATFAQSLGWNPVSMYEWVKNNVETEWYWGCMKGAEETLRQRSGNDCDQAALLLALLRASGFPSRYVRGVIEFFPDIGRARNLTGIEDPVKIAEFFQKAGIPFKPVIAGGRISNFQIEHIWVETQIPYANYRGAILDEHGKTWLGLDTSIKVKGYTYSTPMDILEEYSLSGLRDEYLSAIQEETPLEYVRAALDTYLSQHHPDRTYNDLLQTRALIPEVMKILPASMQYRQVKITHEYTRIPDELRHKVKFTATRNLQPGTGNPDNELFSLTLETLRLSSGRIVLSYEPETIEDQEIINGYGGLDNTPAYLVRLRPVLTLNGERLVVGRDGLPMGGDFGLTLEIISPNGIEKITNTHITGDLLVIGIVAQKPSPLVGEGVGEGDKGAEEILYEEAVRYIDRWNQAEDELAALMHLSIARPVPSVVTVGGVIDVTYVLDTPHGFQWKGVFVDANLRTIETVGSRQNAVGREKEFLKISALQGSILENRLFEDDFRVESISTAKLFTLAGSTQPPTQVLSIDKTNIDVILPTLSFDESIKEDIRNAVNQNLIIRIPQSEIQYEDWTGVGYIKENPETGESGYMLSGMIAGGMTVWDVGEWPEDYGDILGNPYSEPASRDIASAKYIEKILWTDLQRGEVGEPLSSPLTVQVFGTRGKPVKGAEVTFGIKAGGGRFPDGSMTTTKVKTGPGGKASIRFFVGQNTKDNPTFWWESGDPYAQQVGENIVDASLPSGVRIRKPFTAYGLPKEATQVRQTHGDGQVTSILSFAGFVSVAVEDQYGNPVSNVPVEFTALPAVDKSGCANPNQDVRQAVLVKTTDPCIKNLPTLGECSGAGPTLEERTSMKGASAEVIMGSIPYGEYPIRAASGSLSTTFRLYTFSFGNCGGSQDPSNQFSIEYVYPSDPDGNNINAGKTGAAISVQARISFLREGEMEKEVTLSCPGGPLTCTKVVGNRQYLVDTGFQSSSVTFDGQGGVPRGNGIYGSTYVLKGGLNQIAVRGEGTIGIRKTRVICPSTCNTVDEDLKESGTTTMPVYGVDIGVDPIPIILVDVDGYALEEPEITYHIYPSDYKALTALVMITKDGEPIATIPAEVEKKGTATISRGFQFDIDSTYDVEVVLNSGTGVEIRSGKRPLVIIPDDLDGNACKLERAHRLSQFDSSVEGVSPPYTDSFQVFGFELKKPSSASVKILDKESNEKGTLIPKSSLSVGKYYFVMDYKTAFDAGFSPGTSPRFYLMLEIEPEDGSYVKRMSYPGKMAERTYGRMLGQIMVHDVLIQDGSLNLSRQDMALKGRGPQLAFTRSYNNQSGGKGRKPLGEGWSHSLDMRLYGLSSDESGPEGVPSWVTWAEGKFCRPEEIPETSEGWTLVAVNGTTFKKQNGVWYPERGRHGTLRETADSFVYTSKDGTQYRYDYPLSKKRESSVRRIEDRNGNVMTFHYDSLGRLESVEDSVARRFDFSYKDSVGFLEIDNSRLVEVKGPDGIELGFTYGEHGYLESASRDNRIETYEYEPEPGIVGSDYNLVKTTDANGNSYAYEYFGANEIDPNLATFVKVLKSQDVVKRVQYPDNDSAFFQYDVKTGNKRMVTDLNGHDTTYTLNYYGNPNRIEEPGGRVTSMTWSIDEGQDDNVMTSKTDARGNPTSYEFDRQGNITVETDPIGNSIRTTWNQGFSVPERRTDRNNFTQTWQYDSKGNLEVYVNGDGKQYTYTYYGTGERQGMTDPRGNQTTYTYDQSGNPASISEPEGSVTRFEYDIRGRRTAATDPGGNTTLYAYDSLDYPMEIKHPAITAYDLPADSTNTQSFEYDPVGNLVREKNRVELELTYSYTSRNQVKTITRNIGGVKTFEYDPNGNLKSETDWKGVPTAHTYNELNQRVSTTNRLGHAMQMAYDLNGNLIEVTDYEGNVTDYEYDKLNRLIKTMQPAIDGPERGYIGYTYYDEADPKTNLKTETDQEQHITTYEYNGRYLRTKRTNALSDVYTWEYDDSGNLSKETDEEGKYTQYGYDKQNRRISVTRMGGIQTAYQYDANGNQTFVIDALGRATETRYDEWNRAWKVIDADGYSTTTEYDGEGKAVRVVDGNGNGRTWERDERGLVRKATDGEGNLTQYTYDLNGNVESVTDARNIKTKITYDAEDRLITTTEASGIADERSKEISRDRMGNPIEVKDYNGNTTKTEYNALYLPRKVTDPEENFTETTYYRTGQLNSVKNKRGFTTTHDYDELNRETKVTDPKNQTIETAYDKTGHVKTVRDKRGTVTENFYDDLYRLMEVKKAGVRLKTNKYDNVGNLTAVMDANNNRTEHAYSKRNLLTTTTHPDGTTEARTYDGVANLLTLTNEENKVTTYTYDRENRQTASEFAGEKTNKAYDAVGNLTLITRPKGNVRAMGYDGLKRLISVTDDPGGLELITVYKYDANGNQTDQHDTKGNHVEFVYDALNRKTKHIQHKEGGPLITVYAYDPEGNLKETTDPNGQVITYDYDELTRQTDAHYPEGGSPFNKTIQIHTEYDPNNNVTSITETKKGPDGTTFTDTTVNLFDNFDRLDQSRQRGLTISYAYDNNGNRTQVTTPAGTTAYSFDSRNRLSTATTNDLVSTFTYYPDGKKDTITYPNGTDVKYAYHPTNRVATVTHKAGSTVISSYAYQYDRNGNRILQTEFKNGVTEKTTYNYDNIDRLKDFTVTGGSNTTLTEYTYDGYNRKTEKETLNGAVVKSRTYQYDETNWLTRVDDDKTPKTIAYTYDKNGNMTGKSDSTLPNDDSAFAYDSRNQLTQVTRGPPGSEIVLGQYDYNSAGLRVRHRRSERGDVDYYYDDDAVIEEHNASDDTLLAHYRYGDRLLSLDTGTSIQYYHHDALGSTVNFTDESGIAQVSYLLDPWGHIRRQTGDSINRHIFTGQEHDENTGLIYFGARYYDPDIARFITQDTYLGEQNTPPSLNRYLYAYSNPTVYVDLMGYVSNRQVFGIDEESVNRTYSQDTSTSTILWITAKCTLYTIWNGLTGGFVQRQDVREEKFDRGEISEEEFWTGTGIDAGISITSQIVGGKVGGAVRSQVIGATGSKLLGAVAGGGAMSGFASLTEQSAQVLTYSATEGRLGQEKIDFKQVVESAESGMIFGAILHGVEQGIKNVPKLTGEIRNGSQEPTRQIFEIPNEPGSIGKVASDRRMVSPIPKGLGDASTSPWLSDTRAGIASHLEHFREGGSYVLTEAQYRRYVNGKSVVGDPTGQFIVPTSDMDKIFKIANGDVSVIEKMVGHKPGHFAAGGGLVRIDVKNPLLHNARFPSGLERGANEYFRWGGYTSGGVREAVIDPFPNQPLFMGDPLHFSID